MAETSQIHVLDTLKKALKLEITERDLKNADLSTMQDFSTVAVASVLDHIGISKAAEEAIEDMDVELLEFDSASDERRNSPSIIKMFDPDHLFETYDRGIDRLGPMFPQGSVDLSNITTDELKILWYAFRGVADDSFTVKTFRDSLAYYHNVPMEKMAQALHEDSRQFTHVDDIDVIISKLFKKTYDPEREDYLVNEMNDGQPLPYTHDYTEEDDPDEWEDKSKEPTYATVDDIDDS